MIESLHSPHIGRVKALLGSKGVRERRQANLFVAEGMQCLKEALTSSPHIVTLYVTTQGLERISAAHLDISALDTIEVSDAVMEAMASTMTPQGVLALCQLPSRNDNLPQIKSAIYLHEIQDPGNAGTILRTADAMGIDAVFTSPGSVDMYSPKVVRATAGSLWHIQLCEEVSLERLRTTYPDFQFLALSGSAPRSLNEIDFSLPTISIFGNEARGLSDEVLQNFTAVHIPMKGRAESLNLSAAAAVVMFHMSQQ